MSPEIDLVIPWVDGGDPAWQAAAGEYGRKQQPLFRDWGLMRYWFRGVDKYLPWIRRVHFVTWGHLPPWLNTEHPKLHIVRHEDFLPEEYRPVFSSIPIELNFHRIKGLAECFISANDDLYFLGPQGKETYFRDGLPCDYLHVQPITDRCTTSFGHILWNDMAAINRHFTARECAERLPQYWFSEAYPETVCADNRAALRWRCFAGFGGDHFPVPLKLSTYREVWREEKARLEASCRSRFRDITNVNNWLIRYWQLATGRFVPYMQPGRRLMTVGASEEALRDAILSPDTRVLCLNEGEEQFDFAPRAAYIRALFERRLPDMSSFEKF